MPNPPLLSIVVNNYNYARYLRAAIDSALAQAYAPTEVVVVDDGSTDGSREVIESYGERVVPVFKANGGQASAFNAGFAASRGAVVLFLDADDVLLPDTGRRVMAAFAPGVAKVQFRLAEIDAEGRPNGVLRPAAHLRLPDGDVASALLAGHFRYPCPPTSGNALAREVLEALLPMPAAEWRISADAYLMVLAPLLGTVRSLEGVGGHYRVHGHNHWTEPVGCVSLAAIEREVAFAFKRSALLETWAAKLGRQTRPRLAWRDEYTVAQMLALPATPGTASFRAICLRGLAAAAEAEQPPARRLLRMAWFATLCCLPASLARAAVRKRLGVTDVRSAAPAALAGEA